MADTKNTEPVVQQEDDVVKESQRVMKIKVFITIAAILLLVLAAILLWDGEEGYFVKIPTDEGQTWICEIADASILQNTGSVQENGKFKCTFEGLRAGDTEIIMYRFNEEDQQNFLEKRVYHVKVLENLSVMQTSVDREIYEDEP